ncbi:MAG: ATP-binding cassette domain-containing protein [Candidatus Harrisonbacteria bacterium]|nr:ATP-binding cassette domain-containing protein [Candidatus Harrisonbacteria bacterium]
MKYSHSAIRVIFRPRFAIKGRVAFGDCEVNKLRTNELPGLRRQIGIVFQDFRLLSGKTAYENVAFAMEVGGKSQAEIEDLVPKVLDMVGLADRARNFPNELSGGEKQRVAIARAMVNRPAVIVADEPTGNLDPMNTWDIIHLLQKINSLGTTIILATHSKEIIDRLEKRVLSLDMGRLIRDDKVGRYILS